MTRCPEQLGVGAFVLGVLAPAERHRLQLHIDGCVVCAQQLVNLSELPALVARVPADRMLSARVAPSELSFHRLPAAASVAQRRTARRRRMFTSIAAALLVVATTGVGIAARAVYAPARTSVVASAAGGVHAKARLIRTDTGTRIMLSLAGVPAEERCRLVAVSADGRRETAGTWTATYAGHATVTGSSSLRPGDIRHLLIQTLDGHTLLTLPAPRA